MGSDLLFIIDCPLYFFGYLRWHFLHRTNFELFGIICATRAILIEALHLAIASQVCLWNVAIAADNLGIPTAGAPRVDFLACTRRFTPATPAPTYTLFFCSAFSSTHTSINSKLTCLLENIISRDPQHITMVTQQLHPTWSPTGHCATDRVLFSATTPRRAQQHHSLVWHTPWIWGLCASRRPP